MGMTKVVLRVKNPKEEEKFISGTFTLEAMGLVLDPFERKLYKAKLMM
jgi:hypothetical protein